MSEPSFTESSPGCRPPASNEPRQRERFRNCVSATSMHDRCRQEYRAFIDRDLVFTPWPILSGRAGTPFQRSAARYGDARVPLPCPAGAVIPECPWLGQSLVDSNRCLVQSIRRLFLRAEYTCALRHREALVGMCEPSSRWQCGFEAQTPLPGKSPPARLGGVFPARIQRCLASCRRMVGAMIEHSSGVAM